SDVCSSDLRGVLQQAEVGCDVGRVLSYRGLCQPRGLDRAVELLGQAHPKRVGDAYVQRELQLPWRVRMADRSYRGRRQVRRPPRTEVDDRAGVEQVVRHGVVFEMLDLVRMCGHEHAPAERAERAVEYGGVRLRVGAQQRFRKFMSGLGRRAARTDEARLDGE